MTALKKHWLLFFILSVASLLRLWGLSSNPPHLTSDEAALGYNAYSILKTGRDEHGEFLPVVFKSFGDWKPGLYVYLDVPFVAVFGLNEWSTRLPGAISGIIAVWLVYLLAGEIFKDKEKWRYKAQVFSAFFLTISPWHLQFSRGAWEAGIFLTLTVAGVYLFLRALRDKKNYLVLSASCFAFTLWAYQGAKSATLIVVLGLVIFFWRNLIRLPKETLLKSLLVALIVSSPIILSILEGKTGRIKIFSLLSYRRPDEYMQQILEQDEVGKNSWQYILYHSEPLYFLTGMAARWTHHFSGRFLFFEGDWANKRHGVPNNGVLLVLDSIFLVAGFIALVRLGARQSVLFLVFWLLASPIPSALSRDDIHAIRSFNMVVPLSIILALGAGLFWEKVKNLGKYKFIFYFLFSIFYLSNYVYYLDQYWVHAPFRNSQDWQYGYKELVNRISRLENQYKEIVVKQDYTQPYIFFLFYKKYEPARYQKIAKDVYKPSQYDDVGFVTNLSNIHFRNINWSGDRLMSGKLFVVDKEVIANEAGLQEDIKEKSRFNLIERINTLDGKTAFVLLGIK